MFYAWTIGEHFSVCIADDLVCVMSISGWVIFDTEHERVAEGGMIGDDGRRDALEAVRRIRTRRVP